MDFTLKLQMGFWESWEVQSRWHVFFKPMRSESITQSTHLAVGCLSLQWSRDMKAKAVRVTQTFRGDRKELCSFTSIPPAKSSPSKPWEGRGRPAFIPALNAAVQVAWEKVMTFKYGERVRTHVSVCAHVLQISVRPHRSVPFKSE